MGSVTASKPWYQSTTVWVNALTLAVGAEQYFTNDVWIQSNPHILAFFAGALAVTNLLLRLFKTETAIS
ncbi:MAG TPA: hypothetical protein VKR58_05870 [Aquella sp.]|nr:hypothetical protein [Aquella sp.]